MRLSMNDEGIRGQMHRFGGLSKKPHTGALVRAGQVWGTAEVMCPGRRYSVVDTSKRPGRVLSRWDACLFRKDALSISGLPYARAYG